ncbi:CATRA system-associated protein [Streptomyces brevispora]|uniref:CATRA system-associated protein n=1 Tax=Streptomyces brevispora TaxID=887462 RepID=UPI0035D6C598
MRTELSGLRYVAKDILEAVGHSRLTPKGWEQVDGLLVALTNALDRDDLDAFRQALFHLEDTVRVTRAPRRLTGEEPSERVLERRASIQDRIGADEPERERTEDQDER